MSNTLILVGRVAGAFGVKGEVRVAAYTEDPASLLDYRDLKRKDGSAGLTLLSGRVQKSEIVGRAKEIATREEAEALKGLELYVARDDLPEPEEDEFYLTDLIGLPVRTPEGAALGAIRAVQDFGAGDLLEIAPPEGGATWWLPFTREAVPEVNVKEGYVVGVKPEEIPDEPAPGA